MAYNLNCIRATIGCFVFILLALPSSSAFLCEESTGCHALLKFKQGLRSDPEGLEIIDMVLQGGISPYISNLSLLTTLSLQGNRFYGQIPSSLGGLSELAFPIDLTRCSLMMLLDLSFNSLQGSVPVQIGLLSNLDFSLNLSNNHFEGQLPISIGELVSLQAIDFSKNKFFGVIPGLIGSCISLVYLNLSKNMLEGTIPRSLKSITHLEVLDMSHNRLNGTVPIWIANEQMIRNLNLSYNNLSGEVPYTGRITFFFINKSSFLGNVGLCDGSAQLGLPPCEVQKQKGRTKNWVIYSVVAAVAVSCVVGAVFVHSFFFRKYSKTAHGMLMAPPGKHGSRSFTERELETATLSMRGTFGSVYKAIIDNGESTVAVKVLHGDSNQSFKSFKRECQILSEIKHRNLIRLVGYAWNTGFKALVLDFIGNGNLAQHLYPGGIEEGACKLTSRERISIAIDIANGLEYLQEGQNVLINTNMVAQVADFGIGKLISADKLEEHLSTMRSLRGSIGYIPPEYGQGVEVSAKGDVYSFGVVLLEMFTRKRATSNVFSDGLDLRKWVGSAFPDQIWDVVDTTLKQEARSRGTRDALEKLEQCSIQLLEKRVHTNDPLCPLLCQC
ncbi:hypothetical protein PRUPE_6G325700 [Prunus persica]|uniref:Protein kinase domain-containing protein n=1 Tax=Prunus persica TaxID=3760 RepID=A0A251NYV6_PRUPE|nr:hypothetical protein PRUPE_6G325700 [Prunus persica]